MLAAILPLFALPTVPCEAIVDLVQRQYADAATVTWGWRGVRPGGDVELTEAGDALGTGTLTVQRGGSVRVDQDAAPPAWFALDGADLVLGEGAPGGGPIAWSRCDDRPHRLLLQCVLDPASCERSLRCEAGDAGFRVSFTSRWRDALAFDLSGELIAFVAPRDRWFSRLPVPVPEFFEPEAVYLVAEVGRSARALPSSHFRPAGTWAAREGVVCPPACDVQAWAHPTCVLTSAEWSGRLGTCGRDDA